MTTNTIVLIAAVAIVAVLAIAAIVWVARNKRTNTIASRPAKSATKLPNSPMR